MSLGNFTFLYTKNRRFLVYKKMVSCFSDGFLGIPLTGVLKLTTPHADSAGGGFKKEKKICLA
jgi:hypothetical protein